MVFSDWLRTPAQMLAQKQAKGPDSPEDRRFRADMWEATKTQFIFYGWILIRRHSGEDVPPATGRAQAGFHFHPRMMEWLLEWESAVAAPDGVEMLFACQPSLSPYCVLKTIHRVHEGRFAAAEFVLEAARPFDSTLQCQGWLAQIVSGCDGQNHLARALRSRPASPGSSTPETERQGFRPGPGQPGRRRHPDARRSPVAGVRVAERSSFEAMYTAWTQDNVVDTAPHTAAAAGKIELQIQYPEAFLTET